VRHCGEESLVEPQTPASESFRVTTGAAVRGLTRQREEVLVGAGVAADPYSHRVIICIASSRSGRSHPRRNRR